MIDAFNSVAIVKPDHIGDLVLSAPAIRFVATQVRSLTLYVQSKNLALAEHLFPDIELQVMDFPHLAKGVQSGADRLRRSLQMLDAFDFTIVLREDAFIQRHTFEPFARRFIVVRSGNDRHESYWHQTALQPYFGHYEPSHYWPSGELVFPDSIHTIGFSIGSGFPSNKWSLLQWLELGRALINDGKRVRLIGGEGERSEMHALSRMLGISRDEAIVGGSNFSAFFRELESVDLVVGSDGGTTHLCSLTKPVLDIVTAAPLRRFAPFGRQNRVISLELPCSPCLNSDRFLVNGCLTYECSYGIAPEAVRQCLNERSRPPGTVVGIGGRVDARLFYGVSHWPS